MREGSAFEGTASVAPADTLGSYYALDITQPDALTADASGNPTTILPATFNAPLCLNASGDASCGKDAADATVRASQPARAWPTVLWEIADVGDLDVVRISGCRLPGHGGELVETLARPGQGLHRGLRDRRPRSWKTATWRSSAAGSTGRG